MTNKEVRHSVSSQWLTLVDFDIQLRDDASRTACAKKRKQLEAVVNHLVDARKHLIAAMSTVNAMEM